MVQKRLGETLTTSVSVSREFMNLVKHNNLSPTEVFRKGVAVSLCEIGVGKYYNPMNQDRLKRASDFLEEFRKYDDIKKKLVSLKELLEELNNF